MTDSAALRCEKCGGADVLTRWHGEGAYHMSRNFQPCWGDYGQERGKPKEEHLHYFCRTCQFSWTGPLTPVQASAPTVTGSSHRADDPGQVWVRMSEADYESLRG